MHLTTRFALLDRAVLRIRANLFVCGRVEREQKQNLRDGFDECLIHLAWLYCWPPVSFIKFWGRYETSEDAIFGVILRKRVGFARASNFILMAVAVKYLRTQVELNGTINGGKMSLKPSFIKITFVKNFWRLWST